jgi:hypothetical protein
VPLLREILDSSSSSSSSGCSGIALGYRLDDWTFKSRQGMGIFLFTTASRPALGPTQPTIRWVTGDLSLGVKRSGREANY